MCTKLDVYVLLEKTIGGIKNLETTVTFSTLYTGQRQKDKLYEKIGLENIFEFYSDPDQYRRLKIFKKIISNKCLLTVSCFLYSKTNKYAFLFSASVDLDAQTTHIGDLIFTVRMTDDENDTLTFTMTTDPSNGPFQIKDCT